MSDWNRRDFLRTTLTGVSGLAFFPQIVHSTFKQDLKLRAITSPPGYHWFGYYDKWQMDPTGQFVLGMQVDFEHRTPEADDVIKIGVIDLENDDKWTEIGESRAWNWQQGCMLQWVPGSETDVLWNDREGDRFISRIMNIRTGESRILPRPVYALSPDGQHAVTTDFERINNQRPGYGYAGIPDPYGELKAPPDGGIYRMDLRSGDSELILPYTEIVDIPHHGDSIEVQWHWFNHLLVNTDGSRFVFLHRWREEMTTRQQRATGGWTTRMFSANMDGSNLYLLNDSGLISHFIWRDPVHINAWTRPEGKDSGFYLMEDQTRNIEQVGKDVMIRDGHLTYVPNANYEWILNDTYPDQDRNQELYLYHIPTGRKITLGHFYLPEIYTGEWRCDLHPRSSQDGTKVIIDSPHESNGRQLFILDISHIIS
ncbi:MAG: hypothetical protein JJU13_03780 [Balneolaceae bacterium]|nr:hypothetical protein [Balneolaceae bacterium]